MDFFEKVKCKTCKTNYGAESRDWLCSVCYKIKLDEDVNKVKQEEKILEEKKIEEEKAEEGKPKQTNLFNCWKCEKKVGHLGFKCECGYVFCKSHRHFSDHECTFDFKTGKK